MDQIVENYRYHFRLHLAARRGDDHWAFAANQGSIRKLNQNQPGNSHSNPQASPPWGCSNSTYQGNQIPVQSVFVERLIGIQTATISISRRDPVDGLNLLRLDRKWMKRWRTLWLRRRSRLPLPGDLLLSRNRWKINFKLTSQTLHRYLPCDGDCPKHSIPPELMQSKDAGSQQEESDVVGSSNCAGQGQWIIPRSYHTCFMTAD